jgi:hypothetical protein
MKVWITKYALSTGIREAEVEESVSSLRMVVGKAGEFYHGEGKEWHRTEEAARVRANEMVQAKIASLKKQLVKLEAMKF